MNELILARNAASIRYLLVGGQAMGLTGMPRFRETLSLHKELAQKLSELERKIENHDENIRTLFEAIYQLMTQSETPHEEIGFHVKETSLPDRVKVKRK